jgi:hypothetical protein
MKGEEGVAPRELTREKEKSKTQFNFRRAKKTVEDEATSRKLLDAWNKVRDCSQHYLFRMIML